MQGQRGVLRQLCRATGRCEQQVAGTRTTRVMQASVMEREILAIVIGIDGTDTTAIARVPVFTAVHNL